MLAVKYLSLLLIFSALTLSPLYGQDQQSAEIIIAGADNELSSNIRNYLRIGAESCDTPLSRLNRLAPQVRTNIRDAGAWRGGTFSRLWSGPESERRFIT